MKDNPVSIAAAAVHKWRAEHQQTAARINVIVPDRRNGVLIVGTEAKIGRSVRDILTRVAGDVPIRFVRASWRFHNGGAGNQLIRPLQGGTQITDLGKDESVGTLGLVVNANGVAGFLTAGHIVDDVGTGVGQPDTANAVGVVTVNGYLSWPFNVDAAFVTIANGVTASAGVIWQSGGPLQMTTVLEEPEEGQYCSMQGAVSGSVSGTVEWTGVQVGNYVGLAVATYTSSPGDSGAPVYASYGQTNEFLGLNSGEVTLGNTNYAVFTQVNTIQSIVPFTL